MEIDITEIIGITIKVCLYADTSFDLSSEYSYTMTKLAAWVTLDLIAAW